MVADHSDNRQCNEPGQLRKLAWFDPNSARERLRFRPLTAPEPFDGHSAIRGGIGNAASGDAIEALGTIVIRLAACLTLGAARISAADLAGGAANATAERYGWRATLRMCRRADISTLLRRATHLIIPGANPIRVEGGRWAAFREIRGTGTTALIGGAAGTALDYATALRVLRGRRAALLVVAIAATAVATICAAANAGEIDARAATATVTARSAATIGATCLIRTGGDAAIGAAATAAAAALAVLRFNVIIREGNGANEARSQVGEREASRESV